MMGQLHITETFQMGNTLKANSTYQVISFHDDIAKVSTETHNGG